MSTASVTPEGPKPKKKPLRKRVWVWVVGVLVVLGVFGAANDTSDDIESTVATTVEKSSEPPTPQAPTTAAETTAPVPPPPPPAPVTYPMPNVVGMTLQAAQDTIQRDTQVFLVVSHDLRGDRFQINDTAWTVCDQNVAPGTPVDETSEGKIDLGVVKSGESCSAVAPAAAPAPAPAAAPAPAPDVSASQENALEQAESYLRFLAFSRSGLIEQLEYEGYSSADAAWAADEVGADWNEQAAKAARNYLDTMAFSRSGLIQQLVFEGYTQAQAEYGVSEAGL